jgi:hypothetical protein
MIKNAADKSVDGKHRESVDKNFGCNHGKK